MLKGTVKFCAKVRGNGFAFALFEFNPNEPGVGKVAIEGPDGSEILSTVHLAEVVCDGQGRALATKVNTTALDRIAFFHGIIVENARITDEQFSPLYSEPHVYRVQGSGGLVAGGAGPVVFSIPSAQLKMELERASPSGEHNFGSFRSARQSVSPVEQFISLYNILLTLYNGGQSDVDSFILDQDPAVPQTQSRKRRGSCVMETVYTRLRNELAHLRHGVNLDDTKVEMGNRLGGLIELTKRAIELHP